MNAPQNQQPTVIDSMDGTLTEWYNAVDDAFRLSEVIPGNYEYTIATSYGNQCPVSEGGMTNIDISCERFHCISLDNTYILFEQTIPIHIPAYTDLGYDAKPDGLYIGYKSVFDAIDQYRIYSNGDLIQTQNHANYESFIMYNLLTDQAKNNSDLYATCNKLSSLNPNVPGVYIDTATWPENKTINIHLKLRLPISMFLLFTNLKWMPGFMGKITLELYFSYKNLVVYPLFQKEPDDYSFDNPSMFSQINSRLRKHIDKNDSKEPKIPESIVFHSSAITCSTSELTQCRIYTAQYMLNMDVYNALMARYIQYPILFPIQTVQVKNFTKAIGKEKSSFNCATSLTLTHCDSMYIVFNKDKNSRTCFENPEISFQVNIDGKFYPRERYNTVEDPRFTNMVYDCLNINNSALLSIPDDLRTSLQPYTKMYDYTNADENNRDGNMYYSYNRHDRSNFMIAIPFSNDEDFMGGISSGSTMQIELVGSRIVKPDAKEIPNNTFDDPVAEIDWDQNPTGIYFEDAILKIRSVKPPGAPQIQITNASIEQIIASNRA